MILIRYFSRWPDILHPVFSPAFNAIGCASTVRNCLRQYRGLKRGCQFDLLPVRSNTHPFGVKWRCMKNSRLGPGTRTSRSGIEIHVLAPILPVGVGAVDPVDLRAGIAVPVGTVVVEIDQGAGEPLVVFRMPVPAAEHVAGAI